MNAWRPHVRITRIVDGDTFRADLDKGWNDWTLDPGTGGDGSFRIVGINAPERGTPGGTEATAYLATLLPVGGWFEVLSYEVRWRDNFGRTLADVLLPDARLVSQAMLDAGHAVVYREPSRTASERQPVDYPRRSPR